MKNVIKLFTVFMFSGLSMPSLAEDDCNPEYEAFCGEGGAYYPNGDEIVRAFIGAGLLVGGTVGLYFLLKNDKEDTETTARIMADYYAGKGLRLTSYESIINVSLFTPRQSIVNQRLSNLSDQYKVHENTYNLVNISLHWQ